MWKQRNKQKEARFGPFLTLIIFNNLIGDFLNQLYCLKRNFTVEIFSYGRLLFSSCTEMDSASHEKIL